MTRPMQHTFILLVCLSLRGVFAQTPTEPDLRLWSVDLDAIVRHYGISRSGLVFARTEKAIAAWRVESGQQAWRVELPSTDMWFAADDRGLIYNGKSLIAFDLDAGKSLWTLDSLPLKELREMHRGTDDVVLAMGPVDEKVVRVLGIELATGRVLWQSDSLAQGDRVKAKDVFTFNRRAFLPDSTLILQFNRGGIVRFNATTGAVVWRLEADPPFTLGWPAGNGFEAQRMFMSAEPLVSGDHLVTTSGAIDLKTGAIAWRTPEKPSAWTSSLTQTPAGVLTVRATTIDKRTLQLVDATTGKGLWPAPVALKGNLPLLVQDDTIFVGVDRGLAMVSLSKGALIKQVTLPDFTSAEEPTTITSVGDGDLLLRSYSNLLRVTREGKVVFHRHYGVPPVGLRPLTGVSVPTSRNPRKLTYFHTNDSDSLGQKGIVLVDPDSGEELGTARRKDRAPSYAIDAMTQIAIGIDDRRMTGYKLAPLPGRAATTTR